MSITSVVSVLHLSEAAKMLSSDESGGSGHWSISTLLKSMSMPLVPLEKMNKAHFVIRCLLFSSVSRCVGQKWNRITTGKLDFAAGTKPRL